MRKLSVEVLETASHPEGGYAVVLLHGIDSLPDGATFRIKPVDARGRQEEGVGASWPTGDHRPRAVRRTDAGIELLIGPDIVESPALVPGTLGVIEIQAAGVRGEFLWPSIRPTARPRRRHLTVVKPAPEAKPDPAPPQHNAVALSGGLPVISVQQSAARDARSGAADAQEPTAPGADGADRGMKLKEMADPLVTAQDHGSPAVASIEQALGAKVVQLDRQRDRPSAAAASAAASSTARRAPDGGSGLRWSPMTGRVNSSARLAALAASFAVVVSGGFLLLGHRQETSTTVRVPTESAATSAKRPATDGADEPASSIDTGGAAAPTTLRTEATAPGATGQRVEAASLEPGRAEPRTRPPTETPAPAAASPAASQEVTLRMRGGGFQITGELKGFDGAKYVIESRVAGVLTMDASRFECLGEACGRPAAAILTLSERPSPAKPDVFRIEGSPALATEFIPQLVRDYAASIGAAVRELPGEQAEVARYRIADQRGVELATIEVHRTATTSALAAVDRGASVIGLIDRPHEQEARVRGRPTARGKQQAPAQPIELVVGLDGIAVVAATDSALASISIDNLAKVLAGQITDWYDLGLPPGPITVYLPPDGMGTMDAVQRQILRPRGLEPARAARRLASDEQASDAASRDPRGVAVVGLAAQRAAKAINLESACGLIARPTPFAIKTGEYPLIRRLSLHMPANVQQPSARGMLRLAQSNDVAAAVTAARLVDQSVIALPIEEQSERMAWAVHAPASSFDINELRQMLGDLDGAMRLSVTFRFVAGTNEPDAASRPEVARLAAMMREAPLTGQRIILAGFTDAGGKFQSNLTVSQRRAGQVRSALVSAAGGAVDPRLLVAKGYGSLAPVACNGTAEGQRLNRRVEVWVAASAAGRPTPR